MFPVLCTLLIPPALVRCTNTGRLFGVTSSTSTLQGLLQHRDLVLQAVHTVYGAVLDVVPQQKWKWARIHNVSLVQYMGRGGNLRKLREELEAENAGVHIPADIRWLGRAKVRARFQETRSGSSSVVAAVLGEAVFSRLCRGWIRLPGGRYEVDAYEEGRPDALCQRCGSWGHVAPHCEARRPNCSLCAEEHATSERRCLVKGR